MVQLLMSYTKDLIFHSRKKYKLRTDKELSTSGSLVLHNTNFVFIQY